MLTSYRQPPTQPSAGVMALQVLHACRAARFLLGRPQMWLLQERLTTGDGSLLLSRMSKGVEGARTQDRVSQEGQVSSGSCSSKS